MGKASLAGVCSLQAGSMMLQSGAHLGRQDFEEAKRCAKAGTVRDGEMRKNSQVRSPQKPKYEVQESRDLFKSAGDFQARGLTNSSVVTVGVHSFGQGEDSIEDFLDHVEGYEKGRRDPRTRRTLLSWIVASGRSAKP